MLSWYKENMHCAKLSETLGISPLGSYDSFHDVGCMPQAEKIIKVLGFG